MFHRKWPTKLNFLVWKSAFFAKSSPRIFLWDDEGHARSAENVCIELPTKLNFLHRKSAFFAKSSLHFLWDDKGRARSADNFYVKWQTKFNISLWRSPILAKSSPSFFHQMIKAARAARNFFQFIPHFLISSLLTSKGARSAEMFSNLK